MPWQKRLKFYPPPENVSVESEVSVEAEPTAEPEAPAGTETTEEPEASEPEAEPTAEPTVEPTEEPEVPEVEPTEEPAVEPTEVPLTACPTCGVLASRDPLFETNHKACDACGLRNCDPAHARKAHTACSGCGLRKCAEDFVTEEHMKCAGCREMLCASEIEHISCPGCHRYSCKEIDQYDTYNHTLNDYGRYPCLDYPEEPEVEEPEEPEDTNKPSDSDKPQEILVTNEQQLREAVQKGGTIKISTSFSLSSPLEIPEGLTVVIIMNGHTLSAALIGDDNPVILNNGTLNINGGRIESTATNGGPVIKNNGTMIISNTHLEGAPLGESSYPRPAVYNNGDMTLNRVTLHSIHTALRSEKETDALLTLNNCKIVIEGFYRGGENWSTNTAIGASEGKIIINGGTYVNNDPDASKAGSSVISGNIEIQSGSFSGLIAKKNGIVIYGGTFNNDPSSQVADGYTVKNNGDGTWTVNKE